MQHGFLKGFESQTNELSETKLDVHGEIPIWLRGVLYRNGPALYQAGRTPLRHWFDGYGMLHRFVFDDDGVSYLNRFIQSRGYQAAQQFGKNRYYQFATAPEFNRWQKFLAWFKAPESSYNTNVNIARYGDALVSMTEKSEYNRHDPVSLATLDPIDMNHIGEVTTAHPHYDYARKEFINFGLKFGPKSVYRFYRLADGASEPQIFAEYAVALPSYVHSFGLTQNYVILFLTPLKLNPLKLRFGTKPYYEVYRWFDNQPARIIVLSRKTGETVCETDIDPCFVFHFVNCFEQGDELIMDYCAANNQQRVNQLYINYLQHHGGGTNDARPTFRRCTLNLQTGGHRVDDSEVFFELPTINYQQKNMRNYQHCYGISFQAGIVNDLDNEIVKLDVRNNEKSNWYHPGFYPGEPLFVARPESTREDDGVLLSVVLDSHQGTSFLLVLDAVNLKEMARIAVPQHIPFGFHGAFYFDAPLS